VVTKETKYECSACEKLFDYREINVCECGEFACKKCDGDKCYWCRTKEKVEEGA
jgi:hypothetical protein